MAPVEWNIQRTIEISSLGVKIGCWSFTDLDYADDVALLVELLYILIHGLGVTSEEACLLGLLVNWAKTNVLETMTQFRRWSMSVPAR